jgi:hypothetical protein
MYTPFEEVIPASLTLHVGLWFVAGGHGFDLLWLMDGALTPEETPQFSPIQIIQLELCVQPDMAQ